MNSSHRQFSALLIVMGAAACATAPPVPDRPAMPALEDAFASADAAVLNAEPVKMTWWQGFGDDVLTRLVAIALEQNKDLAVAAANVDTARASLFRQDLNQSLSTSSSIGAEFGRAARDGFCFHGRI